MRLFHRLALAYALALSSALPFAAAQGPAGSVASGDAQRLGAVLAAEGDTLGAALAFGAAAAQTRGAAPHFNAGTLYLAAGRLGPARYHLEAAHRLDPAAPDVARNLRLAREALGAAPPSAGARLWARVRGALGAGGLVALALALYGAVLGAGVAAWQAGAPRRRLRAVALGLAPVAALALVGASVAVADAWRPQAVVVAEAPVPLRTAPGAGAALGEAPPGLLVRAGRQADGWQRVALPGGGRGWLPARALATL